MTKIHGVMVVDHLLFLHCAKFDLKRVLLRGQLVFLNVFEWYRSPLRDHYKIFPCVKDAYSEP